MPYGAAAAAVLVAPLRKNGGVRRCAVLEPGLADEDLAIEWIGWDDASRGLRLQHIVNNSRLLVVACIRNLASMALSRGPSSACAPTGRRNTGWIPGW